MCHNHQVHCDYWDQKLCHSCTQIQTPYPQQVASKQARIQQQLLDVGADPTWFPPALSTERRFRTKVKLVVAGTPEHVTLGILDRDQNGVDLSDCPIVAEPIRLATHALRQFISHTRMQPYNVPLRRGELKFIVVTSGGEDPYAPDAPLMIRFVLRSRRYVSLLRTHLEQLRHLIPQAHVITANIHPVHEAIIDGPDEVCLTPSKTLPMRVGDAELQLGPRAFSQTNTAIASQLYRQAAHWLDGEYRDTANQDGAAEMGRDKRPELWDLYCGVGGFAVHAALHSDARVTGIEIAADAVSAASKASAKLGLEAHFVVDDATTWAMRQPDAPHTVIVNPPRRGIGPALAHWLDNSGVQQVIYSSCNPQTLASDLHSMPHMQPVRAQLFDMFPHTAHCEVLCLITRVM